MIDTRLESGEWEVATAATRGSFSLIWESSTVLAAVTAAATATLVRGLGLGGGGGGCRLGSGGVLCTAGT